MNTITKHRWFSTIVLERHSCGTPLYVKSVVVIILINERKSSYFTGTSSFPSTSHCPIVMSILVERCAVERGRQIRPLAIQSRWVPRYPSSAIRRGRHPNQPRHPHQFTRS